jgi:hypothetical protein
MKNSASVVNLKRSGIRSFKTCFKKYSVFHAVQFYLQKLTEKAIKHGSISAKQNVPAVAVLSCCTLPVTEHECAGQQSHCTVHQKLSGYSRTGLPRTTCQ